MNELFYADLDLSMAAEKWAMDDLPDEVDPIARHGKRKTGRAYRREMAERRFEAAERILSARQRR